MARTRKTFVILVCIIQVYSFPQPQYGPTFGYDYFNVPQRNYENLEPMRQKDVFKGTYPFIDSNGKSHIVYYTTGRNGFTASVDKSPENSELNNNGQSNSTASSDKPDNNVSKFNETKIKDGQQIQFVPIPVFSPEAFSKGYGGGNSYYPYTGYSHGYRPPYGYPPRY